MIPRKTPAESLSDRVSSYLVNHIRTGQLRSGDKIPSEVRVSADLGISRGIVREAYRALRVAGILEISNGRSPRVGRMRDEGIGQVLSHALATEQASVEQVLELRAAIEIRAAELAAMHRNEQDLEALRAEVETMQASAGTESESRFIEADTQFHQILARATGNPVFALVGGAIRASLMASIRAGLRNRRTTEQIQQIVATHREIAGAIGDRDPARARTFMTVHFEEALRSFVPRPDAGG